MAWLIRMLVYYCFAALLVNNTDAFVDHALSIKLEKNGIFTRERGFPGRFLERILSDDGEYYSHNLLLLLTKHQAFSKVLACDQ